MWDLQINPLSCFLLCKDKIKVCMNSVPNCWWYLLGSYFKHSATGVCMLFREIMGFANYLVFFSVSFAVVTLSIVCLSPLRSTRHLLKRSLDDFLHFFDTILNKKLTFESSWSVKVISSYYHSNTWKKQRVSTADIFESLAGVVKSPAKPKHPIKYTSCQGRWRRMKRTERCR